ncbi:MAG TPA: hypothetical protein VIW24_23705 [Aldersonia sp.]
MPWSRLAVCGIALGLAVTGCSSDSGDTGEATATAAAAGTTTAAVTTAPQSTGLFDQRYCEVVPMNTDGDTLTEFVYNTLGLNDCPEEQWSALTTDIVNQEYGSQSSELNGPRHWVLDGIVQDTAPVAPEGVPTSFTFGGIDTTFRAQIEVPVGSAAVGTEYYSPNPVRRDTVWVYDAGRELYQLTDPAGNVYVMQSYSQQVDDNLSLQALPDLGPMLQLPPGWSFATVRLTDELNLVSGGTATVIQDNLLNSYQMRTPLDTTGTAVPAPTS